MKRTAIYFRRSFGPNGTDQELPDNLAASTQDRGDILVGIYCDDARITGKGKNAGWRRLLADLETIDQIVLADAGDLPGRTVGDLLGLLATLTHRSVTLVVPARDIDTSAGSPAILELVRAYRRAKLSEAIRRGQEKARSKGRHIGRPPIPEQVRRRIVTDLGGGASIRGTARKFGVAPASVVNIRQAVAETLAEAA